MSTQSAFDLFVTPMLRRFTIPTGIPGDAFSADTAETLASYSDHQLEQAAIFFRDNRTQRTFPTIAECRQACERYVANPVATTSPKYTSEELRRSLEHTHRLRQQNAYFMCRCNLGRRAAKEGWLGRLVDFVTENQRLPNEREQATCQKLALKTRRLLESMIPPVEGSMQPMGEQIARYRSQMNYHRAMLEGWFERVFGKDETPPNLDHLYKPHSARKDGNQAPSACHPTGKPSEAAHEPATRIDHFEPISIATKDMVEKLRGIALDIADEKFRESRDGQA